MKTNNNTVRSNTPICSTVNAVDKAGLEITRASVFERNSKKTIAVLLLIQFVVMDFCAAHLLIAVGFYQPTHLNEATYRVEHSVYHHGLKANLSDYQARFGPLTYSISTNSLGFKDSFARDISLKSTKPRLLIIGDSFAEGVGVEYENTFTGILSRHFSNKGVEVLNASVASYSPIIYLRKIEHLIENGLAFGHLVVFLDLSDISNEYKHYAFDENRRVVSQRGLDIPERIRNFLSDNTFVMAHIRTWFQIRKANAKLDTLAQQNGYAINHDQIAWSWNDKAYKSWGIEGLRVASERMTELSGLMRSMGIPLTLVIYPWPDQVWREDLNSKHVEFWSKWSKELQVPIINLFPEFIKQDSDATETIKTYFFKGDVHWNEEGHKLVASRLIRELVN